MVNSVFGQGITRRLADPLDHRHDRPSTEGHAIERANRPLGEVQPAPIWRFVGYHAAIGHQGDWTAAGRHTILLQIAWPRLDEKVDPFAIRRPGGETSSVKSFSRRVILPVPSPGGTLAGHLSAWRRSRRAICHRAPSLLELMWR